MAAFVGLREDNNILRLSPYERVRRVERVHSLKGSERPQESLAGSLMKVFSPKASQ